MLAAAPRLQRGGSIILQVVRGRDRETLHGFIRENVSGDVEAIYTDQEHLDLRACLDDQRVLCKALIRPMPEPAPVTTATRSWKS